MKLNLENGLSLLFIATFAFVLNESLSQSHRESAQRSTVVNLLIEGHSYAPDLPLDALSKVLRQLDDYCSSTHVQKVRLQIELTLADYRAAEQIEQRVKTCKGVDKKHVEAHFSDTLTGPGLLIASAASHVYALPGGLVGGMGMVPSLQCESCFEGYLSIRSSPTLARPGVARSKIEADLRKEIVMKQAEIASASIIANRVGKATIDAQTLNSGNFWSVTQALQIGLIDEISGATK